MKRGRSLMNQRKILKNKWFLYLTEFFSGVSLMAVELVYGAVFYFLTTSFLKRHLNLE